MPPKVSLELREDGTAAYRSFLLVQAPWGSVEGFEEGKGHLVFELGGKYMIRMHSVGWSLELSSDGQTLTISTGSYLVSPGTVKLRKK